MSHEVADAISRVLKACRAVELAMEGLYETLAELHEHDPRMARLWRKTAMEEGNHAAQFGLLLETMPEGITSATVDAKKIEALHRSVENAIEEFRLRPPSVREALVAAIDFEESMDRIHAHEAIRFAEPSYRRMFQAMMAADSGHIAKLRLALRRLGPA
jgi:rubrerythrin